ncbi:unnamed protein product [Rangifer tarandus platyrhynchus]|uniref:Uncharacterized protein n=2 Tax=Rangifer tarandus platyrhynchus TaxID=3082113 RepID=A0AC60A0G8_RANTA|nr:unnamed protein product [Rangifer tarandus platyrhynchus]
MNPKTLLPRWECLPLRVCLVCTLCAHSGNRGLPATLSFRVLRALCDSPCPDASPCGPSSLPFKHSQLSQLSSRRNIICQKIVSTLEEFVKCNHVDVPIMYMYNLISSGEPEFGRYFLYMFEAVG